MSAELTVKWLSGAQTFDGERVKPLRDVTTRHLPLAPLEAARVMLRRVRYEQQQQQPLQLASLLDWQVVAREVDAGQGDARLREYAVLTWPQAYRVLAESRQPTTPAMYAVILEEDNVKGFPLLLDLDVPAERNVSRAAFVAEVQRLIGWLASTYSLRADTDFLVDDTFADAPGCKHSVHIMCRRLAFRTTDAARAFVTHVLRGQEKFLHVDPAVPQRHGNFKLVGCAKSGRRNAQYPWRHDSGGAGGGALVPECDPRRQRYAPSYDRAISWYEFHARRTWIDDEDDAGLGVRYLDQVSASSSSSSMPLQPPWSRARLAYYGDAVDGFRRWADAAFMAAHVYGNVKHYVVHVLDPLTRRVRTPATTIETISGLFHYLTSPQLKTGLPVRITVALRDLALVRVFAHTAAEVAAAGARPLATVAAGETWAALTPVQLADGMLFPGDELPALRGLRLVSQPLLPYSLVDETSTRPPPVVLTIHSSSGVCERKQ